MTPLPGRKGDRLPARALVALYPPAWRERYAEELLALIQDTGLTPRAALHLAAGAAAAWIRIPRHLLPADKRLRASVSAILAAWTVLAGAGLVYGQLSEDQALRPATAAHPLTAALYQLYTLAAHASVALLALGAAPLYLTLARDALRRRHRDLVLLSLPATGPLAFLAVLIAVTHLARTPGGGIGPGWFTALTVLGAATGIGIVAGLLRVLHRGQPSGAPLRLAAIGAIIAGATMTVAALAAIGNAACIAHWDPGAGPASAHPAAAALFLAATLLAGACILTSAARALRPALSRPS